MLFYSMPFEKLATEPSLLKVHTVIVGSGYGAAFAALALAMRSDRKLDPGEILVLERGNEFHPGEFPKTLSDFPDHVSTLGNSEARTGYADALFDVRVGTNVNAIVGSGLGGTSLINANVAVDPDAAVVADWPHPLGVGANWLAELQSSIKFVRDVISVRQHPRADTLAKVAALKRLNAGIDAWKHACDGAKGINSEHRLADLAVSFDAGPNRVGVQQRACNDCGNCFTGCNIGAKNTLAMNAWPLAHALGVTLVTGCTVRTVKPPNRATTWTVEAHRTTDSEPGRPSGISIQAQRVILAAGTFGSTEILHRSWLAPTNPLTLSKPMLGRGFSLNGDAIAFGFGQRRRVASFAKVPSAADVVPAPNERPGPTIVSMISVKDTSGVGGNRALIEDATVPQTIARFTAELLSTQAMTFGYVGADPSAWHRMHPDRDPLTVNSDLMDHHQPVLMMGTDDASGLMAFNEEKDHIALEWPDRTNEAGVQRKPEWLNKVLSGAHSSGGFDGGLYVESAFWQPLPRDFAKAVEGANDLGGVALCNHPLGGCAMADDASQGIVNTLGQVFDSVSGKTVHAGLYVLDGSIIPGSLGINPFVTIAALSHFLASQMDAPSPNSRSLANLPPVTSAPQRRGREVDWPVPAMGFVFHERLIGPTQPSEVKALHDLLGGEQISTGGGVPKTPDSDPEKDTYVIDIDIHFPDVYAWLENPQKRLNAVFKVFPNTNWHCTVDTVEDKDLGKCIARGNGFVTLLSRDENPPIIRRSWLAFRRFWALRRDELWDMLWKKGSGGGVWQSLKGFARVAAQHAHWRYMRYECDIPLLSTGGKIHIQGVKRLAYDGSASRSLRDEANLWTTLCNIELTFARSQDGETAGARFRVDVVRMARQLDAFKSISHAETPQVIGAVANAASFVLRTLIQTHFWSFGAPPYEKFKSPAEFACENHLFEAPTSISYQNLGLDGQEKSTSAQFPVISHITSPDGHWRLLRAGDQSPTRKPLLLIHGVSHSSRVFHTETLPVNLSGFLLNAGYDVWILDHGLSTALEANNPRTHDYHPTLDEVSIQISAAVTEVYHTTGRQLLIFSHCIGAAALSMSILRGDLEHGGTSMIEALALHAVPPWIHASAVNLIRAYAGAAFRNRFFPNVIDPIPPSRRDSGTAAAGTLPSGFDQMLDRIGTSLPWTQAEFARHSHCGETAQYARTICNRMTLLYGYEWSHENLENATHDAFPTLMGPANVDAYRQLYFLVNRGRVTDKNGVNAFVQESNFKDFWKFPTLFLHGYENEAFDVESSYLSRQQLQEIRTRAGQTQPVYIEAVGRPTGRTNNPRQYGHLDMLLGRNACKDAYPKIQQFFEGRFVQDPVRPSKTPMYAAQRLLSGPILSRPVRNADGTYQVRLWAETLQFTTGVIASTFYKDAQTGFPLPMAGSPKRGLSAGLPVPAVSKSNVNALRTSIFWLADYFVTPQIASIKPGIPPGVIANYGLPRYRTGLPGQHSFITKEEIQRLISPNDASLPVIPTSGLDPVETEIRWGNLTWFKRFMTDGGPTDQLSFVVGSCWYPGAWFDKHLADQAFKVIRAAVQGEAGIDLLLLVGDQIYADASAGFFDIAENRERYQENYRTAFQSPWARWVLANVPTYFAIDDHEIRDNYPTRIPSDTDATLLAMGNSAAQEAWNFQAHSDAPPPVLRDSWASQPAATNNLYYSFDGGKFPFFVFDTRSERNPREKGLRRLLSESQETVFKDWASSLTPGGPPAILVTGSPLAPVPRDEVRYPESSTSSDGLRAFPEFIDLIGRYMAAKQKTLILLSGDPHFSSMCEFGLQGDGWQTNGVSIISSGIYVPLPFANDTADNYDWGVSHDVVTLKGATESIGIELRKSTLLSSARAHAVRIDITKVTGGPLPNLWRLSISTLQADSRQTTSVICDIEA